MDVHIRWMIRRDMPEMLAIEQLEYGKDAQTESEFVLKLRQRRCIGMVAEHKDEIVGFMIYELHKTRLYVLDFVVDGWYRRNGIGSQMVRKLIAKLDPERRSTLVFDVHESSLDAHLFLKSQGFTCVATCGCLYRFAHWVGELSLPHDQFELFESVRG